MSKFNVETMGNNLIKVDGHLEFHLLDMIKAKNLNKLITTQNLKFIKKP